MATALVGGVLGGLLALALLVIAVLVCRDLGASSSIKSGPSGEAPRDATGRGERLWGAFVLLTRSLWPKKLVLGRFWPCFKEVPEDESDGSQVQAELYGKLHLSSSVQDVENFGATQREFSEGRYLSGGSKKEVDNLSSAIALKHSSEFGIELKKLRLGNIVGEGANGRVFRATYLGSDVAVKEVLSLASVDSVEQDFITELEVLRRLRHPHVVELYGAGVIHSRDTPGRMRYLLVTELAPCSLRDLLDSDEAINIKQSLRLATEMSKGLAFIHAMKVVHFDIKPANLLLSDSGKIKICDLGVSRIGSRADELHGSVAENAVRGTPTYCAPELLKGEASVLSFGVDVFSFSIVLWELLHRRRPHPSTWTLATLFKKVLDGRRPKIGPLVPARLRRLLLKCWDHDPSLRPEFEQILVELAWVEQELRHPQHAFLSTHVVDVWVDTKFKRGRVSRNIGDGNYEIVFDHETEPRRFRASEIVLIDGGGGAATASEGDELNDSKQIVFRVVHDESSQNTGAQGDQKSRKSASTRETAALKGSSHKTSPGRSLDATPRSAYSSSQSSATEDLVSDVSDGTNEGSSVEIGGIRIGEFGIVSSDSSSQQSSSEEFQLFPGSRGNFRADLVILDEIGRGASGVVHRALQLQKFKLVAVKSIRVKDELSKYQIAKEIRALDAVVKTKEKEGNALIRKYGAFWEPDNGSVRIVLEYMDGGSCDDLLSNWRAPLEHVLAAIAIGTLQGLKELHRGFRLHRDVKPANILLDRHRGAKLSDLGLAKDIMTQGTGKCINDAATDTFVGTIAYMSPERLEGKQYSYAADIWSFGITLTSLGTGQNPLKSFSFFQLLEYLESNSIPEVGSQYSDELRSFLAACMKRLPEERSTAEDLLRHPWLLRYESGELPDPKLVLKNFIEEAAEGSRYKRDDLMYISARLSEHLRSFMSAPDSNRPRQFVVPISNVRKLARQLGVPVRHVIKNLKAHGL